MCNKFIAILLIIFISFLFFMGYSIEHKMKEIDKLRNEIRLQREVLDRL